MTSQNTSSLISMVYKSRTVLLNLMNKQDYITSEYEGFSVNEINTMKTNNQLDMILEKSLNKNDNVKIDENAKENELDNVVVVNSIEEIPTLVFNENNCFNSFSVVIDRDVYNVIVFEKNNTSIYKQGRFLKSTNEYKMYISEGRIDTIDDEETVENIMMTFPRYYHIIIKD